MKKYRIFVSGVQKELKEERFAVKDFIRNDVLLKDYFEVFLFEDLSAKSESTETISLKNVSESDIYLGLFWNEYGRVSQGDLSATEKEYWQAKEGDKEILIFVKGRKKIKRDKRLKTLLSKIADNQHGHCYERFETVTELEKVVFASLIDFLKKEGIIAKSIFDESVCKNASLDDIDEEKVRWFLRMAKERRKYPINLDATVKDALLYLNLISDGKPTNAAVLLFGKNPIRFFHQANVKCIQFPATEVQKPFTSYHIYEGNLFEQIDKSVAFVLDAIRFPVVQQEHTVQVKRQLEIPVFAIEEAIVNAVAHRDYNSTASVQVMVFIDRVEVWNPGRLPDTLTVSDLRKPHASHPNNPLIARPLYLADYIQQAGSGTVEMIRQCKAQGLPEPEFVSTRWEFRTILARDIYTEGTLIKFGLSDRQIKAVLYVKEKGRITNREYRQLTGLSDEGARRDLNDIVKKKVFKMKGKGRSISYVLFGS